MTFSIGEVAKRFGVEVSTLRWWEKCGLLVPSGRESGRRRYDAADIRRVALIQLLQETALMSLDEIRMVLSGGRHSGGWRQAVQARLTACEEQQVRLRSAQAYLSHALNCRRDDPVDGCPHLAGEIDGYVAALGDRDGDRTLRAQHRSRRRSEVLAETTADRRREPR
ncbi:hypothetical protein GCM10022419_126830 [Nonomuraea rosea]|uniref:HTH merR-type domain-containing protein n=1 Tax=Nonomuraea rosea TaxID=638574 RepID=A0ABP6ZUI0_9ACTN